VSSRIEIVDVRVAAVDASAAVVVVMATAMEIEAFVPSLTVCDEIENDYDDYYYYWIVWFPNDCGCDYG
jgi:hypothetical protein